jgi:hypothetical protein
MKNYKVQYELHGKPVVSVAGYSEDAAKTAAKRLGGVVLGPFKPGQVVEPDMTQQAAPKGRVVPRKHTAARQSNS